MTLACPLRFEPIFRRYLWGGRRLERVLGKSLGEGDDYAESWEVVDHGADQSIVVAGELQGTTLNELVRGHGAALLGRHHPRERFPLLFKFLDAHRDLSVQVHPDDEQAARQTPPDLGKTEAWVILHADPGSLIYAGLKRGFDRAAFERELNRGTTELCLHRFEPQSGDCVFIPAGTVHALGQGLLVAEIQQASDTTFRLFDWNRVDRAGNRRPLHIEQGLGVIDFKRGPVSAQTPRSKTETLEQLVACDKFVLDRHRSAEPFVCGGDDRFHILAVVSGQLTFPTESDREPCELHKGQTALLPAAAGAQRVAPVGSAVVLDMYLP